MTGKQIEAAKKLLPEFSKRNSEQIMIDTELSCREMINSCLAYKQDNVFYNISKKIFGDAAERYLKILGEEKVMQFWIEQLEDFSKATIIWDAYTDSEGGSYNAIKWAEN